MIKDARDTTEKVAILVDEVINEMKAIGIIGEDRIRIILWRFVNEHTKLVQEYYGIGE